MPSPFPGMDPFLEHPELFPDLHDRLINQISESLQASLPARYFAIINWRVWVEYSDRIIEPDVGLGRTNGTSAGDANSGGVATMEAVAIDVMPVVIPVPLETRQLFLEIRTVQGDRPLVAAIEILSPSNKTPGNSARQQYVDKQLEYLSSRVHLVEIDLLRGGTHTTAVPLPQAVAKAGTFDYHICVRPFDRLGEFLVYPIKLEKRLPKFAVPLLPGDPAVVLDLQPIFERCYDTGPYRRLSPYAEPIPGLPLSPERAAWADKLLRERGLRPTS